MNFSMEVTISDLIRALRWRAVELSEATMNVAKPTRVERASIAATNEAQPSDQGPAR